MKKRLTEAEALKRAAELDRPKIRYKNAGKLKGKVAKDGKVKKPLRPGEEARIKLQAKPSGLPPPVEPEQHVQVGRPSDYKPEIDEIAKKAMHLGASRHELAEILKVSERTIHRWTLQHESFCQAIKIGTELANDRVEASLYRKAVGFEFDSEKLFYNKELNDVHRAKVREVVHPDAGAAIFWLKNRRPDQWKERHENVNMNLTIEAAFEDFVRQLQFKGRQKEIEAVLDGDPVPKMIDAAE